MLLCEKYKPNTLNEVAGNKEAMNKLISFGVSAQGSRRTMPLMICGPSGTGKTSAAHALAYSNGFDMLELNASDYRDSDTLKRILLPACKSRLLFGNKMLVVFDEIDELSEREDSGAANVISSFIRESRHPVVFIANDFWSRKIAFLRDSVDKCEFKRLKKEEIFSIVSRIASKEGKDMGIEILEQIASRNNGDIRGAINDLEFILGSSQGTIEYLGMRDRKTEIFGILDKIFMSRNFDIARNALFNTDVDLEMAIQWIDENISNRYVDRQSISAAYDRLAESSRFLENAKRSNYYGYLRYTSIQASSGIAISGSGHLTMLKPYAFPSRIRYLSRSKEDRGKLNSATTKMVYAMHMHKRDFNGFFRLLMKYMIAKGRESHGDERTSEFFENTYKLGKEEVAALFNSAN